MNRKMKDVEEQLEKFNYYKLLIKYMDFLYNNILKLTQLSEEELLNIKFSSMQLLKNEFNKGKIINLLNLVLCLYFDLKFDYS